MRLQRLIVENFRIFRGEYKFDFQRKNVIILSGPNGHGKSSIFDAIQWCLTGDIQRYKGTSEYQDFNYLINEHEYINLPVTMKVEVWLEDKDDKTISKISRIIRKTRNSSTIKVYINDKEYGVREGADKICRLLIKTNNEGEGSQESEKLDFSSLFSASHLLSQDQLRAFVQDTNPRDRFRVLENLLGLKKYGARFREYLIEINEVAQKELSNQKQLLVEKNKLKIGISANLQSRVQFMQDIGEITEAELIVMINKLFLSISPYFRDAKSIDVLNEDSKGYLIRIRNQILEKKEEFNKNIKVIKEAISTFSSPFINYNQLKLELDQDLQKKLSNKLFV